VLEAILHLVPQAREELDVRGEVLFALALGDRAHDEAARGRAQTLDDVAKTLALLLVVDAPGHADVAGLRHVDDGAAGNRHERRDARSLGAERLLGHLDENFLAAVEHLLDRRRRCVRARLRFGLCHVQIGGVFLVVARRVGAVLLAPLGRVVTGVEKRVLREPDVDERGLHPGQHVRDDPLVDAADDGAASLALDVQLGEHVAVLHGDARLDETGIDDDPLSHAQPRSRARRTPGGNPAVSRTAAFGSRAGAPAPSATPPWRTRRSSSAAGGSPRRAGGPSPSPD